MREIERGRDWREALAAAIVFVLPLLPACWLSWQTQGREVADIDRAMPVLLCLSVTLWLLALVGRSRYLLVLLVPSALLAPFELFYLIHFAQPAGAHVFGVIAETNRAEALAWIGPWLAPLILSVSVLIAAVLWAAGVIWARNRLWSHRSRYWVAIAGTLLVLGQALLLRAEKDLQRADEPELNPYLTHSLEQAKPDFLRELEPLFPWGLPLRWARYMEHHQALQDHRRAIEGFDFGVKLREGDFAEQAQIHILVIGETGRPDRWQLFGAQRATTPHLAARQDLLLFKDVVSAASATRESVPLMLTRRPPENMLAPPVEASLLTAYKQAGFKTYWLSTQGAAGAHETPISVLAREADEQHFINAVDYRGAGALDGDLLPHLKQILARPSERKQFIVLHTLGSHMQYGHRYPEGYAKFQPALAWSDKGDLWRSSQKELLINTYDNSVLYTDTVLNQAIELLAQTGRIASLVYAADHGETFFDGKCPRGGHGFAAEKNYRVPMFIWLSPQWRDARGAAYATLTQNTRQAISTLSIFPSMLGLAGIDIEKPHAHPDLTVANAGSARRLLTHFGDFDRGFKQHACDWQGP